MIGTTHLPFGTAPQFGLLYDIIVYGSEPNIVFAFIVMITLTYDPILGAYEIVALWEYRCLYHSSIQCYHLFSTIHHGEYGNMYIKSKYDLSVYCNYMTS